MSGRGQVLNLDGERMLKLHKNLPKAKTPHEMTAIERQIQATDKQIHALVYELYGLTEKGN